MSHCGLVFGEHFNFFFYVCVSKSVMSINGLSFMSARPTPQPCVSVHRCGVFKKWWSFFQFHLFNIKKMKTIWYKPNKGQLTHHFEGHHKKIKCVIFEWYFVICVPSKPINCFLISKTTLQSAKLFLLMNIILVLTYYHIPQGKQKLGVAEMALLTVFPHQKNGTRKIELHFVCVGLYHLQ